MQHGRRLIRHYTRAGLEQLFIGVDALHVGGHLASEVHAGDALGHILLAEQRASHVIVDILACPRAVPRAAAFGSARKDKSLLSAGEGYVHEAAALLNVLLGLVGAQGGLALKRV